MNDDINRKAQKSEILNGGSVKKTLSNRIERQIKDGVNTKDLNKPKDNKTQAQKFKIRNIKKIAEKKAKQENNSTVPRDIRLMPKEKFSQGSALKEIKPSARKLIYAETKNNVTKQRSIKLVPKNKYKLSQGKVQLPNSNIIKYRSSSARMLNNAVKKVASKGKYAVSASGSKAMPAAQDIGSSPPPKFPNALKNVVTSASSAVTNTAKSRTLQEDKDGNTGVEGVKLGLRSADKAVNQARTIKNRVDSTVRTVRKFSNRISRSTTTSATKRTLKTSTAVSKQGIKTAAKASAKAAVQSAKTAKIAANAVKTAAQIAVKAAKAAAQAIQKLVSLIAETAPWSLIIIAVIIVIILLYYIINTVISGAAGSVAGGGGWIANSSTVTEQDLHNNLDNLYTMAENAFDVKVKTPLQTEIDNFYNADTSEPYCMLKCQNTLYYPTVNSSTALDSYFSDYNNEFFTNMVALVYILKRRSNANITYDNISQSDFETLFGDVDNNTCTYGQTVVYKTTTEVYNCTCPDEDCQTEYREDKCAYYYNSEGVKVEFCEGHPYCSNDHTMLQVSLYKTTEYTSKSLSEIYSFTDEETNLFNATIALLQNLDEESV